MSSPPGWIQATDSESGRIYFANISTGETSLDPPPLPMPSSMDAPRIGASGAGCRRTAVRDAHALVQSLRRSDTQQQQQQQQQGDEEEEDSRLLIQLLELQGLTAGQVADLVYLQRNQTKDSTTVQPYTPIDPSQLLPTQERPPTEPGRLQTRMHLLLQKLEQI
mmetsp:Transcript_22112/g.28609  ORF Transcript_22112/g.28609 Transcript_22112/m.28609 type:complete len:164 (+) Transcript_22112:105-596(+)|eukprot:CAMPEP_0198141302 /NCGR_PEP_ID=MMETSP1443-20131203/4339_1 /TAXON_ID=186043 /ORGANISM="Entomoneis sp., Strain CCMP2396" /LENGTH=163 /DNA_ID=CAMNT_0043804019 /DNA_START=82 /DNA_END=573 /DNA_ORIENTATION=+